MLKSEIWISSDFYVAQAFPAHFLFIQTCTISNAFMSLPSLHNIDLSNK